MDVSRRKSVDTLRGYVRGADAFLLVRVCFRWITGRKAPAFSRHSLDITLTDPTIAILC
jgi:hypothetical protein